MNVRAGEQLDDIIGAFVRAKKRANMPEGFRRHDLRHRYATVLFELGVPPQDIQEIMGHADINTTMGYKKKMRKKDYLQRAADAQNAARA